MLCSSCSGEVRPVVAVDIDGTLGDYYEHFRSFAEGYWGRPMRRGWSGHGNWEDHLGMTRAEYRQAKLAYRQGGMKRNLPTYLGADYFMKQLKDWNLEIWVATTRPWQRLDNIDPDTQWWLSRHGWTPQGLLYGDDKYEQLCQVVNRERVLLVVDDLAENLQRASECGLYGWQVSREQNRHASVKWHHRGNFGDILREISMLRETWQKENS